MALGLACPTPQKPANHVGEQVDELDEVEPERAVLDGRLDSSPSMA
jgi:hypothetical protein